MSPDKSLDALIADYTAARDDERELMNQQVALFGAVIAVLGILGAFVTGITGEDAKFKSLPDPVAASAPLVPLALVALLQIVGSIATVRAFYMRALEREISSRLGDGLDLKDPAGLRSFTYRETVDTMSSLSRGSRIPRILTMLIFSAVAVVFVGLVFYMSLGFSPILQATMLLVYGPAVVLIFLETKNVTINGRSYFLGIVSETEARLKVPLFSETRQRRDPAERTLLSYLCLPRPLDLPKSIFFLLGIVVAVGLSPQHISLSWSLIGHSLLLLVLVEILIYQARYQVNDVRGVQEDGESPGSTQRGRIPTKGIGASNSVKVVLGVIALRLYLAGMMAGFPAVNFWRDVVPSFVAVFGLGIAYEYLRGKQRHDYSRACGPERARKVDLLVNSKRSKLLAKIVYGLVGLGYPLRLLLGVWLGGVYLASGTGIGDQWRPDWWGQTGHHMVAIVLTTLVCYLIGLLFVSMTWAFEAGKHVTGQAEDQFLMSSNIGAKPHSLMALRDAGYRLVITDRADSPLIPNPGDRRWLASPPRWFSMWSGFLVLSSVFALPAATAIWHATWSARLLIIVIAMVIVSSSMASTHRLRRFVVRTTAELVVTAGAIVLCAFTVVWLIRGSTASTTTIGARTLLTVALVLGPAAVFKFFEFSNYNGLIRIPRLITAGRMKQMAMAFLRLVVGAQTFGLLEHGRRRRMPTEIILTETIPADPPDDPSVRSVTPGGESVLRAPIRRDQLR